jgi:RNA polymerase sigma-70 factor, ECF subfamily
MRLLQTAADPHELPQEDPTDQVQWNQLIRRAMEQVRAEFEPRSWQAFWRSAVDGIATSVVAEELGVTAASVRQSRSRILRRLRQQLGDCP